MSEPLPQAFADSIRRMEDAFLEPVLRVASQVWYGTFWYGYGGEGLWACAGCGGMQAGPSVWPGGQKRCRACGPGEGWVPCPAGAERGCVLCKGVGYVEELR